MDTHWIPDLDRISIPSRQALMFNNHSRSGHLVVLVLLAFVLLWSCGGDVASPETPGSLSVSVTTTGVDADGDGYTVTLGSREEAVAASGSATFDGLDAGSYEVSLGGVAANCTVEGGSTRSVTVAVGEVAAVTFAVVCESVFATGTFSDAVCPDLSFPATSASPLERLLIGSVPVELEDPLFAYVTWTGGDQFAVSLVDRSENGSLTLVAPYHPSGEMGGGEVSIRIGGGSQACPALDFDVTGLPDAPGELAATVELMQELIEAQAVRVGVTVAELQALDGTTLPAIQILPLLVAQSVVDHPANPNSLRALVDGTAPALDGAELDAADRVLAGTGFRQALEEALADIGPAPDPIGGGAPARVDALDCLVTEIGTAQRLHDCMEIAADVAFGIDGVTGEILSDIAFASGVVGQVNHPATKVASFATGGLAWAFQKLREGTAHLLPSEFVSMELDAAPVEFLEDEESSGAWSAEVRATSKGWELDRAVLEALSQVAGGLGAYGAWLDRFMGADEAIDLAGFVTGEVVSNAIAASGGAGILVIPPESFGPVDVSDEEWSDYNLIPETRLAMTSHNVYEPREHGPTTLSVRTKDGMFGGQQIFRQEEITVGQVQINILPDDITLAPGQDTMLLVTVVNSAHPGSLELHPGVSLQGAAEISYGTADTHFVLYTAPQEPLPGSVDLVTVRHNAESGARGYSEEERLDIATIRFGGIEITTPSDCLDVGAPPLQIEYRETVEGDPELVWDASAGHISETGLFTPPDAPATVEITVRLADNPGIGDMITLQVGGCSCQIEVSAGGIAGAPNQVWFYLNDDMTAVTSFGWGGNGTNGSMGFADDFALPFGSTGGFEGQGSGIVLIDQGAFANPDYLDPPLAPLAVTIVENDGGIILAGAVLGTVALIKDPPRESFPFSMTFRVEADPIDSSDPHMRMCRVD